MIVTDIVVIDSGIHSKLITDYNVEGIRIYAENDSFIVDENIQDNYGHGTAVSNIILSHSGCKVFMLKIFNGEESIDENILIYSLKYIKDNIDCKIINLSLGLKLCGRKEELYEICKQLCLKNIIIVSAFDNDGCMSYPATFECVIGVSNSYKCKNICDFEYVKGESVNILAKGGLQRVLWNDKSIVIGGSSFACAYMTAYISKFYMNGLGKMSLENVHRKLQDNAACIHDYINTSERDDTQFVIYKAAIFPINKEMHALIRNIKKINFSIVSLYDIKQSGRVGANIGRIVSGLDNDVDYCIKDISNFDKKEIDTLIIGHMDEINRIFGEDVRLKIISFACRNGINIFSFDSLDYCSKQISERKSYIYFPQISMKDIPQNTFGKLYMIGKPVLSVLGTSSQQGKFTLQLILKDELVKKGYKVGMLGTEPHSKLFGMDYVYPMGYKSTINVDGPFGIMILNYMLNKICEKEVEIIITGSQANAVPMNTYNISSFPLKQHVFLMGVQPDAVILCINPQDDLNYITNTIKYIEGAANCAVIALVLYPMNTVNDWRGVFGVKERIDDKFIVEHRKKVTDSFHVPMFVLGVDAEMQSLTDYIIDYLGDEK